MKKNHIGAIKGMAIANIVLSAVYAACLIMAMVLMLALGSFVVEEALYGMSDLGTLDYEGASYDELGDASKEAAVVGLGAHADAGSAYLHSMGHHAGYGHGYGHGYDDAYDLDDFFSYGYGYDVSADAVQSIYSTAVVVLLLIPLLLSVLSLVAGILVLVNAKRPEKLQFIMVWSIIGAIASGLSCSLPCLVMFILSAVFANSDKALYRAQAAQVTQAAQVPQAARTAQTAACAGPYAAPSSASPVPGAAPQASPAPYAAASAVATSPAPAPSASDPAPSAAVQSEIPLPAPVELSASLKPEPSCADGAADEDEAAASDEKREG